MKHYITAPDTYRTHFFEIIWTCTQARTQTHMYARSLSPYIYKVNVMMLPLVARTHMNTHTKNKKYWTVWWKACAHINSRLHGHKDTRYISSRSNVLSHACILLIIQCHSRTKRKVRAKSSDNDSKSETHWNHLVISWKPKTTTHRYKHSQSNSSRNSNSSSNISDVTVCSPSLHISIDICMHDEVQDPFVILKRPGTIFSKHLFKK